MVKRMVCPKCGRQGKPNDRFCSKCGMLLVEKEVEDTGPNTQNTNETVNRHANTNAGMGEIDIKSMFSKFLYFVTHMWFRGFDGGEEETDRARYVLNPQPLENQMKKIKNFYPIFLICICVGFFNGVLLVIGFIGLFMTYVIDVCVTEYRLYRLRRLKFWANFEMTDERIFEKIQPVMFSKYGISVSRNEKNQVVIAINDFCYTVLLNSDSTFCIRWDASLKRMTSIILMRSLVYYKYYKEMLGAMGTIAYEIQAQFGVVQDVNENQTTHTYQQQEKEKQSSGKWEGNSYNFSWSTLTNAKTNWIAVVSSILMIICPFLPYVKVTVFGVTSTESLIGGDGIFFLGIGIIALILGLKGKDIGVMFTSIAAGTLTIIEVINFSNTINEDEFGYLMQKESGYYLMIAATIVLVIAGLYRKFMPDAN